MNICELAMYVPITMQDAYMRVFGSHNLLHEPHLQDGNTKAPGHMASGSTLTWTLTLGLIWTCCHYLINAKGQ